MGGKKFLRKFHELKIYQHFSPVGQSSQHVHQMPCNMYPQNTSFHFLARTLHHFQIEQHTLYGFVLPGQFVTFSYQPIHLWLVPTLRETKQNVKCGNFKVFLSLRFLKSKLENQNSAISKHWEAPTFDFYEFFDF